MEIMRIFRDILGLLTISFIIYCFFSIVRTQYEARENELAIVKELRLINLSLNTLKKEFKIVAE